MASSILLRNIGGTDDKRIVMANSQFARLIDIGTTWTTLRVGLRLCIRDTGANITGTPRFFVGLSSGTTNLFGDATSTHAVGVRPGGATWTRGAGPPVNYSSVGPFHPVKRVGSTITAGSNFATFASGGLIAEPASGRRGVFFVDITKGSPNFTFQIFHRTAITTSDASLVNFLTAMELAVPSLTDHNQSSTQTLAVDEGANGSLNAVHVAWDRSTPEFEISDIAYARLA